MTDLVNGLYTYVTKVQPVVHALIAIALIIIGIMFIIPSEETKGAAKKALAWVLIGGGIILGASQLATEFTSNFAFSDTTTLTTP